MSSNLSNNQLPQSGAGDIRGSGPRLPPQAEDKIGGLPPPAFYTEDATSAQRSGFLPKPAIALLALIAISCYFVLALLYWIFRKRWFESGTDTSEDWSQTGGYWTVHFWIFSKPLYYIWYAMIPLLLIVTPRRVSSRFSDTHSIFSDFDSSLKSLFIIILSIYTHEHLRWWIGSKRPMWSTTDIVMRESCDCSFGTPNWEAHHGFLLWAFFVYEFIIHTQHLNKIPKFLWIGGITFIILNIALARIFYGQATWSQAFLGALHGGFWFGIMTLLNDKFNAFFDGVLGSKVQNRFILIGVGLGLFLINTIFFYSFIGLRMINPSVTYPNNSASRLLQLVRQQSQLQCHPHQLPEVFRERKRVVEEKACCV